MFRWIGEQLAKGFITHRQLRSAELRQTLYGGVILHSNGITYDAILANLINIYSAEEINQALYDLRNLKMIRREGQVFHAAA